MANYLSTYSGTQIDAVIQLFHEKGLGQVVGAIARQNDGSYTVVNFSDIVEVTPGSAASFTQGTDSFQSGSLGLGTDDTDKNMLIMTFNGGSFSQGTDSFSANVPTSVSVGE